MTDMTNNAVSFAKHGIVAFFRNAIADYKADQARRAVFLRTYQQLNAMSDRDLEDIGINRLLIEDVAREAAYGKAA